MLGGLGHRREPLKFTRQILFLSRPCARLCGYNFFRGLHSTLKTVILFFTPRRPQPEKEESFCGWRTGRRKLPPKTATVYPPRHAHGVSMSCQARQPPARSWDGAVGEPTTPRALEDGERTAPSHRPEHRVHNPSWAGRRWSKCALRSLFHLVLLSLASGLEYADVARLACDADGDGEREGGEAAGWLGTHTSTEACATTALSVCANNGLFVYANIGTADKNCNCAKLSSSSADVCSGNANTNLYSVRPWATSSHCTHTHVSRLACPADGGGASTWELGTKDTVGQCEEAVLSTCENKEFFRYANAKWDGGKVCGCVNPTVSGAVHLCPEQSSPATNWDGAVDLYSVRKLKTSSYCTERPFVSRLQCSDDAEGGWLGTHATVEACASTVQTTCTNKQSFLSANNHGGDKNCMCAKTGDPRANHCTKPPRSYNEYRTQFYTIPTGYYMPSPPPSPPPPSPSPPPRRAPGP